MTQTPYIFGLFLKTCPPVAISTALLKPTLNQTSPGNKEKTALEWLEWVSQSSNVFIKHQFNGKEQKIGHRKLPVDGWCAETKTIK